MVATTLHSTVPQNGLQWNLSLHTFQSLHELKKQLAKLQDSFAARNDS